MLERYHDAVAWLDRSIDRSEGNYMASAQKRPPSFFLERMRRLAAALGNPQDTFEIVHVAGTSGKGSTTQMVYEMLHADGRSVGLYQSPYVNVPTENIQVGGRLLAPDAFADAVSVVRPVVEEVRRTTPEWTPSYAEIFFAVALVAFRTAGVQWLVLETGCGGRYDKTNIVRSTRVVGLTPIGIDHVQVLGETREEIAHHKAGIIKGGSVVFSSETDPAVQRIFTHEAHDRGVRVRYTEPGPDMPDPPADATVRHLIGPHQEQNARLAMAIANSLNVSAQAQRRGLAVARLPARIEPVQDRPRVIIDGAHSEAKYTALVRSLQTIDRWDALHLVVAPKEGKDVDALARHLATHADRMTVTAWQLPGFGSAPPAFVQQSIRERHHDLPVTIEPDPDTAVQNAIEAAAPNDLVLVTSSLYLAGIVRKRWYPHDQILLQQTSFPDATI